MITLRLGRWPALVLAFLGMNAGALAVVAADDGPPALERPVSRGELLPDPPTEGTAVEAPPADGPLHEAFDAPSTPTGRSRAPKSPPPPIVERPSEARPTPDAQWVAGYWSWSEAQGRFEWVSGAWRVAPRGMLWVNGRWQRDEQGWSRVPGFWSPRQAQTVSAPAPIPTPAPIPAPAPAPARTLENVVARASADWRTVGPPSDHPADDPGPAPNADSFYVPGHYTPDGDRVTWTPGFWADGRVGWDWVPARWVRRPDGWQYREGSWVRDADRRNDVRRDDASGLPPAIVDSQPPQTAADDPAKGLDPLVEKEPENQPVPPAVVVIPRVARYPDPYAVPPVVDYRYYGPRSPRANIPWGVLPPFTRRILNRILP